MKLQALTVCIYYSDYLAATVANRRHFDRWLIVTVPDDRETIAFCQRNSLECLTSTVLQPDGWDFDPKVRKAVPVNEGLDVLPADEWTVLLDADVLLPSDFRHFLQQASLDSGSLYFVANRRICASAMLFAQLSRLEPWRTETSRGATQACVSIFIPRDTRYPLRDMAESETDDRLFAKQFAPPNLQILPCVVLHAGETKVDNAGRVSPPFACPDFQKLPRRGEEVRTILSSGPNPARTIALLIGCRDALELEGWLRHFDDVYAFERFDTPNFDDSEAHPRLIRLAGDSAQAVSWAAAPLDAVYFAGELREFWELELLLAWAGQVRPGGLLCGDCFGRTLWQMPTLTLLNTVGAPDLSREDGFWAKRCPHPERLAERSRDLFPSWPPALPPGTTFGVVIVCGATEIDDRLVMTMLSTREAWSGSIHLFCWGLVPEHLRLLAAKLAIPCFSFASGYESREDAAVRWREAKELQPFSRVLLVASGTLFAGPLEDSLVSRFETRHRIFGLEYFEDGRRYQVPVVFAEDYAGEDASVILFLGDPARWSESSWQVWSRMEAAIIREAALEIAVETPALIFSIVDEETAPHFERSCLTWRFPEAAQLHILHRLKLEELWLPYELPNCQWRPMEASTFELVLREILAEARAHGLETVTFLSPKAGATPGTDLFRPAAYLDSALVLHAPRPPDSVIQKDRFHQWWRPPAAPLIARVHLATLEACLSHLPATVLRTPSLEVALREALAEACQHWTPCDAGKWGWHFS